MVEGGLPLNQKFINNTMTQEAKSTTALDVCASRYTGKERDTESGNDYFGARYYGSSMGRFSSPDPSGLVYADPTNPQSFNLYAYVQNNPLVNVDPTGLDCVYTNDQTSNSVGVTVVRGDCRSETDNGTYVDGTINTDSLTYSQDSAGNYNLGYSYSPDDASGTPTIGTGTIGLDDPPPPNIFDSPSSGQLSPYAVGVFHGVAQDTRSLPWLCNAGLNARAAIPKTGIAVGGALDKKGLHGSLNAQLAPLPGGGSFNYTQTGSTGGVQVNVPIPDTPFRASAGISPGRFNLGASTAVPGTKNAVSAGATLSFGYLGDATCRN